MEADRPVLYTIGHSTHSLDAFVALLKQHGVTALADVRSQPYSPRQGQFNREELSSYAAAAGIGYVFLGNELGARREEPECYEGEQAIYCRIRNLPRFQEGLARLRQGVKRYRIALMCAEKDPLDCHRTILICRELRKEFQILHILADGGTETQEEAEKRLVREMDVFRSLFDPDVTDEDLIQQAYDKRATQIAYCVERQGVPQ